MKVAVLGFGTVGRGVYEMLQNCSTLSCDCVLERPGVFNEPFIVNDINAILEDRSIEAVAECIGGTTIAHDFAVKCLSAGKHFVTSNKALISAYGLELRDLAAKNGASLLFSAACGGTMPVLHNMALARRSDTLFKSGGILNGTCNFMLTKMQDEGSSFEDALAEARRLGYAEADPSADLSGLDTLRKVILLSAVGFDAFPCGDLLCEGIQNTDAAAISELKARGLVLRLIGSCGRNADGSLYAFVQPVAFSSSAAEANVKMNTNMAFWEGENCGRVTISGQGAGRYPTAANVLRDLTELPECRKSMLSSKCREEKVNNGGCEFRYIVIENGSVSITEKMPVSAMFAEAEKKRKQEAGLFFAAMEE